MSLREIQADLIAKLDDAPHLEIYQKGVKSALLNVLSHHYRYVKKLLGAKLFMQAANEYIQHYPCECANVNDYGEYFSQFASDYEPLKKLEYIKEVAKLEWTCRQISQAPDDYLNPPAQTLQFFYPVLNIILACRENTNETIDLSGGMTHLRVFRRGLEVQIEVIG